MPTLNRTGKEAIVNHHNAVPFGLLEPLSGLFCGTGQQALGAVVPRCADRVPPPSPVPRD